MDKKTELSELTEVYAKIYERAVELACDQEVAFKLNKKETQCLIAKHISNMMELLKYQDMAIIMKEGK